MTSSSGSRSHERSAWTLRLFILFFLLLTPADAYGAAWAADPGLLSERTERRLRERYPSIESPDQLESLLKDVAQHESIGQLEAHFQAEKWQLSGKTARIVRTVEVKAVTREVSGPLETLSQQFIGQVDSMDGRGRLLKALRERLVRQGFRRANLRLVADESAVGQVAYRVLIDEGAPCQIAAIKLSINLPTDAYLSLAPGDTCGVDLIEAAVTKLEDELRLRGYNQLRVELAGIDYDRSSNTATVRLAGLVGERVRYEINDLSRAGFVTDVFTRDDLGDIDPQIVGAESMAAELTRRFRGRGFDDVTVTGPLRKTDDDGVVTYQYTVDPGTQYNVANIKMEGATAFSQEELLNIFDLGGFWQTSTPLNHEALRRGTELLTAKYQQEGYWDARISAPRVTKNRDSAAAQVVILIQEGQQRVFKQLIIEGNKLIDTSELAAALTLEVGAPLDRNQLAEFEQTVRQMYIDRGFLYAKTQAVLSYEPARTSVPTTVTLKVTEGPRVRIGDVHVTGLATVNEKVVRRELHFERGDWYSREVLEAAQQALTNLSLFRSVQISPSDPETLNDLAEVLDLTIDVRETNAGSVAFGPGIDFYTGYRYSVEAAYKNLGGVGRQIYGRGSISEERQQKAISSRTLVGRRATISYLEPYVWDLPISSSVTLSHDARAFDFWSISHSGEVAFSHRFRSFIPGSIVSAFYGQKVNKEEAREEQLINLIATGDVRIGRSGLRAHFDGRNDLGFPTSGSSTSGELSWARYELGGDLRYFRWEVTHNRYFGFMEDFVFAVGLSAGAFEGVKHRSGAIERDVLPASERLHAGGTETVRGFPERSLGPVLLYQETKNGELVDAQARLGGSARTLLKTELRYQLIQKTLAVTGFIDSGNTFFSDDEMRRFAAIYNLGVGTGSSDLKRGRIVDNIGYSYSDLLSKPGYLWSRNFASYGLALNYLTPLGSINIAYGIPWREPKTQECLNNESLCTPLRGKQDEGWLQSGQFHINLGASF